MSTKRGRKEHERRQYGTGSIYQRASDGYWVGTVEAGWTRRGTRRRIPVYGKTRDELETKLKRKKREIANQGVPSHDANTRMTVKVYAEQWLERIVHELRPQSYNADRGAVKNWIVPTIGHKRFENLTPGDVRAVANAQRAAGRTSSTALRTHSTLTKLLKAAMLDGHPVPQRVLLVEAPTASKSDRDAIPTQEALAILEEVAALPHGSRWVAALLQGMRQAECLGLTWPLVDLDSDLPTFDVSWQLQPLPYLDRKNKAKGFRVPDGFEAKQLQGRMHLVRPKTAKGQRIIPLVPWMVTSLKAWRDIAPPSPHGLVWPNTDGSPKDAPDDLAEWESIQAAAGVRHASGRWYGTHEARHTTATLLLEAGIDPEVIKAILGHSSIVTSRLYMHVNKTLTREAMEKVATRLQLG